MMSGVGDHNFNTQVLGSENKIKIFSEAKKKSVGILKKFGGEIREFFIPDYTFSF